MQKVLTGSHSHVATFARVGLVFGVGRIAGEINNAGKEPKADG